MKSIKKWSARGLASLVAFTPVLVLAQYGEINTEINKVTQFINNVLIPLVFAIALVVFIWGAFKFFIWKGNNSDAQKEGHQLMIYAIVGFVLMVSVFGIVNLIANGLGFSGKNIENIPNAPTTNN